MPEGLTEDQEFARLRELREEYRSTVPLAHSDHYSKAVSYQNWLEDMVLQREAKVNTLTEERDEAYEESPRRKDEIRQLDLDVIDLTADVEQLNAERNAARHKAAIEAVQIIAADMQMYWRLSNEASHGYNRARAHEASSLQDQIIQHFGLSLAARISEEGK